MTGRRPRESSRDLLLGGLHLAVLWALGVAQPLFELLGNNAAFFAIRGSKALDIVVFAVVLVAAPPLALLAVETLAWRLVPRLHRALHLTLIAALVAIIALQVLERAGAGESSEVALPLAVLVGGLGALGYRHFAAVRSFLTVLSPAPLLFLVLFLFFSPVSDLVIQGDAEARLAASAANAPVVFVVFDEFPISSLLRPDGRIDAERYPHFATLARDSTWFRRTGTVQPQTEHAVPAVVTGQWPRAGALPILADHPQNIFTLLGRSHDMHATESLTRLCPPDLCHEEPTPRFVPRMRSLASDLSVVGMHLLLPDDLRARLPSISGTWQNFRGGTAAPTRRSGNRAKEAAANNQRTFVAFGERDRATIASDFVASIGRGGAQGRPPFYFIHILLPHTPWQYLPSGREYGRPKLNAALSDNWGDDPAPVERAYQRHLLQVGYVDRMIGEMLRRLRATRLYDRSLVVVTADHGASFHPSQPFRILTPATEADIAFVPLFVKAPKQKRGRVSDTPVQTVDVLPTMADALGIKIPWHVDGQSGLGDSPPRRAFAIYSPVLAQRKLYPLRRLEAGLAAAVRRKAELFGTGNSGPGLFRLGPHPELLGRPVDELSRGPATGLRASIDDAELLAAVNPATGFVPVQITGELHGSGDDQAQDVAIAVNGRVAAVTRSVPGDGPTTYAAVLPESALRSGANQVEVFAVTGQPAALTPLARTTAAHYTLGSKEIRSPEGRRIPLVSGRIEGFLGPLKDSGDDIEISGWGAAGGRPVDRVLVFSGRRFVGSARPDIERPDVGRQYKTRTNRFGFSLRVPFYALQGSGVRLSAFALSKGEAGRLAPTCGHGDKRIAGCD